jgi:signal transduction histidine kinase
VLGAWAILTVLVPEFRFAIFWPRARTSIETAGILVSVVAAALAYLRYSFTGGRSPLLIALAFVVIAANQLVFGTLVEPSLHLARSKMMYFFTAGRILAGGLMLAGAATMPTPKRDRPKTPLRTFLLSSAAALALMALLQGTLWIIRRDLPPLSSPSAHVPDPSRSVQGLAGADVLLGACAATLYIVGSFAYLRRSRGTEDSYVWLPAALMLAAFSQIHYTLFPIVFTNYITAGDFLRILFSAALLIGVFREIRLMYLRERTRTRELAAAHKAEHNRVQELEQAARRKAELTQLVSHDMAHAVASLRAYAVALEQQWAQLSEGTRREVLRWIERESGRLRDLMEEAGTMATLDSGQLSLSIRPLSVADLVREAADSVDGLGGSLRVFVEPSAESALVDADPVRMLQVFRNLLRNAEAHSAPADPVDLLVRCRNGEVVFSVRDRGPGISGEDVPRLFKRFSRLRPRGGKDALGSGLGLYISRRIVEAHAGRIWVETAPGEGSAFEFSLPLAKAGKT